MTFLYNAWVIPLRSTFPFQTDENENYWLAADICADIIYFLDVVFIKHRIMFLHEGFWVHDRNLTRKNYMKKLKFKVNISTNIQSAGIVGSEFNIIQIISDGHPIIDAIGFALFQIWHEENGVCTRTTLT